MLGQAGYDVRGLRKRKKKTSQLKERYGQSVLKVNKRLELEAGSVLYRKNNETLFYAWVKGSFSP